MRPVPHGSFATRSRLHHVRDGLTNYPRLAKGGNDSRRIDREEASLLWNLNRFGAPLVNKGKASYPLGLEETLAQALYLARRRSDVARVWPVVFAKHHSRLLLSKIELGARRLGQMRTLGFYLSLLAELLGDDSFMKAARRLAGFIGTAAEMEYFFDRSRVAPLLALARRRTPRVAAKWCFWMNATVDWFRSCFLKYCHGDV